MFKNILLLVSLLVVFGEIFVNCCLITNCPRGGKRSGKFGALEANIKPCVSCGPGHSGQCFGPSICCGPFGCLMGTPETLRCQREGFFHEREPCIAGGASCRKNTGRCAIDGICCSQDSCHVDKQCALEDKSRIFSDNTVGVDLYNLMNPYNAEISIEK
ncbi:oxytocin-neurophysin 1-like [Anoplophora glabripennis]|uniref:oxytocin-neurophysin 1-like n=1 Tax=Anoplophora glabripennis TaxID=217634 RepID=UPI000A13ACA1|nr:oxytocin-neurophysin 1-like [Anoplophora glabripennis]